MTKSYYVQRKADDLRMGDFYCHWANNGQYPEPRRILDIKKKGDKLQLVLDDGIKVAFFPEHVVVVRELA